MLCRYNTDKISKAKAEELGASILYDKSLKGKLGSWGGDFRTNMWYAALHTGQSPNNIKDVDAVSALAIDGLIIGKAIYENKISLKQLQTYVN